MDKHEPPPNGMNSDPDDDVLDAEVARKTHETIHFGRSMGWLPEQAVKDPSKSSRLFTKVYLIIEAEPEVGPLKALMMLLEEMRREEQRG